jgi:Kef-type K+ transport system membrane component KefB
MKNLDLAIQFFLQIAVILGICRAVGLIAKRFGQPQVVAEMIAGVLLGPSLFGLLAPDLQKLLFPWDPKQSVRDTSAYLFPASQLGLALYMFIVGLEFRTDIVRKHLKSSIAVSASGMLVPFLLGGGLGYLFHSYGGLFPEKTTASEAAMFLGASMCITAFPMLARIIHFKGLQGTLMGTVAIGAGAIDDAMAWCLLALVLASFDSDMTQAIRSIGGGICFVFVVTMLLRPILLRFRNMFLDSSDKLSESGLVISLMLMSLGAWFTDSIHLHAVFGAFLIGTAIPRGEIHTSIVDRIQPLTVALLLPLFFTYSGLNTRRCCDSRQMGCLYPRGKILRFEHSRCDGDWSFDECSRVDGVDHHQQRPRTGNHLLRTLCLFGNHGHHHHPDGLSPFRSDDEKGLGHLRLSQLHPGPLEELIVDIVRVDSLVVALGKTCPELDSVFILRIDRE